MSAGSEVSSDTMQAFDRQTAFNRALTKRLQHIRVEKDFMRTEMQTRIDELESELHRMSTSIHRRKAVEINNDENNGNGSETNTTNTILGAANGANGAGVFGISDAVSISSRGTGGSPERRSPRGLALSQRGIGSEKETRRYTSQIHALTSERDALAARLQMHARQLAAVHQKVALLEKGQDMRLDKELAGMEQQSALLRKVGDIYVYICVCSVFLPVFSCLFFPASPHLSSLFTFFS